jgi:hypothetical protein
MIRLNLENRIGIFLRLFSSSYHKQWHSPGGGPLPYGGAICSPELSRRPPRVICETCSVRCMGPRHCACLVFVKKARRGFGTWWTRAFLRTIHSGVLPTESTEYSREHESNTLGPSYRTIRKGKRRSRAPNRMAGSSPHSEDIFLRTLAF